MPQISATLDSEIIYKINKIAKKEKRSFSAIIKIFLQQALEKYPIKKS